MLCTRMNQPRRALLLMRLCGLLVFLLIFSVGAQDPDTSMEDGEPSCDTARDGDADTFRITCRFTQDLNKEKIGFNVRYYAYPNDSAGIKVFGCFWTGSIPSLSCRNESQHEITYDEKVDTRASFTLTHASAYEKGKFRCEEVGLPPGPTCEIPNSGRNRAAAFFTSPSNVILLVVAPLALWEA